MSETCSAEHQWVCLETEGVAGELIHQTPVVTEDIEAIESGAKDITEVCPGVILCSICKIDLLTKQPHNEIRNVILDFANKLSSN